MIAGIQLKVCGLTSLAGVEAAGRAGADFFGFNLYPPSPRHLTLAQFRALEPHLPKAGRVAVLVEPADEEFARAADAGFGYFQVHFRPDQPQARIENWAQMAGRGRLWLAPKLPPSAELAPAWLPLADSFLLDTFAPDVFGGSGKTGDWEKFARIQRAHPDKTWILSGGLAPGNIAAALRESGARFVDVNSGVESAPGVKDPAKIKSLATAMGAGR